MRLKDPRKTPMHLRFAIPPVDIATAVHRMRVIRAFRRGERSRSWSASFAFTNRTKATPKFQRFTASAPEALQQSTVPHKSKSRSWSASFRFTDRLGQKPLFE